MCAGAAMSASVLTLEADREPAQAAQVAAGPTLRLVRPASAGPAEEGWVEGPGQPASPAVLGQPSATELEGLLRQVLERFDRLEQRVTDLESLTPRGDDVPVGQIVGVAADGGASGPGNAAVGQLASRLAALESRVAGLDRPRRVQRLGRQVRDLRRRFERAEEQVKISNLSVNQQVELAIQTPLGREVLKKVNELEEKLDAVLSKRMVAASQFANLIPGLWGTYYSDRYLTERVGVTVDPRLDFDWGRGAADVLNGQTDNFSIRWEGVLRISEPGTYSFYTMSDDGIRFWLGEQLILAEYDDHAPKEDVVDVVLEAGDYPLRVEYYEHGGLAVARLLWKFAGQDRGAIPAENLFHLIEQERM